jgi:Initiator Replication protein
MSNKNELVVKSNRLVEASYRLTLAEQRIILLAIVKARRTQTGLSEDNLLTILATDYAEMFGVPEKQAYEQIKTAAQTLFRRYVVLYDINPKTGKKDMMEVRWVSSVKYLNGEGAIQFRFAQDMVPYITRLEAEFTRYNLEKVAKMSSAYAIRLYELLMQWGSVGRREIELEWLKKTLMVDKDYPRLFDFKKWVLDVALSQINEHSDLTASYTQRKTGRNVTHLIFTFAPKEEARPRPAPAPAPAPDAPPAAHDSALSRRLRGHGISAKLAAAWIQQDEARALAAVDYVEARALAGLVKGSTAGYLRTLFESGAEFGPSAFEAGLKAQAGASAPAKRKAEAAAKRQAAAEAKARAEKNEAERLALLERFQALPEAGREGVVAAFLDTDAEARAGFKRKGFESPFFLFPFVQFLKERGFSA